MGTQAEVWSSAWRLICSLSSVFSLYKLQVQFCRSSDAAAFKVAGAGAGLSAVADGLRAPLEIEFGSSITDSRKRGFGLWLNVSPSSYMTLMYSFWLLILLCARLSKGRIRFRGGMASSLLPVKVTHFMKLCHLLQILFPLHLDLLAAASIFGLAASGWRVRKLRLKDGSVRMPIIVPSVKLLSGKKESVDSVSKSDEDREETLGDVTKEFGSAALKISISLIRRFTGCKPRGHPEKTSPPCLIAYIYQKSEGHHNPSVKREQCECKKGCPCLQEILRLLMLEGKVKKKKSGKVEMCNSSHPKVV
eukprot:c21840_g1_i3 orf=574-1488(-)